jgi:hypothetical protein
LFEIAFVLDSSERVLWSGKPEKIAFLVPALFGVPISLGLFGFALVWLIVAEPPSWSGVLLFGGLGTAVLTYSLWLVKKFSHVEYMITDKRLLIKRGADREDLWFTPLSEIKDVIVKIGYVDKSLGTGRIYPITSEFPYASDRINLSWTDSNSFEWIMKQEKKVYNIVEGKYEKVNYWKLLRKTVSHPHFKGLKNPYVVKRLLREAIENYGTGVQFSF